MGLFLIIFWTIVVLPMIPHIFMKKVFDLSLTIVILMSAYATSEKKSMRLMLQVVLGVVAIWISRIIEMPGLNAIAKLFLVMFFLIRVVKFIQKVSGKEEVDSTVIAEAINGYLLLGIAFGVLIDYMAMSQPEAFSFTHDSGSMHFFDPYYYAFVTVSTLGYGDLLPELPSAKALAILITLSGQIYLVTIMAFLIGKLLAKQMVSGD